MAGDMYIRDLRNTKGHISPCTHAQWHPTDRYTGMTSSDDGSIRVWDTWNVLQKTVIKPQLAKPGRIAVTACAYNHDGGLIGGGMFDGTLQIWDVKGMLCITKTVSAGCQQSLLDVVFLELSPSPARVETVYSNVGEGQLVIIKVRCHHVAPSCCMRATCCLGDLVRRLIVC